MKPLQRATFAPDSLVGTVSAFVAATYAATADVVLHALEREGLTLHATWGQLADVDSPRRLHLDLLVVVEPELGGYPESVYEVARARAPNAAIAVICSSTRARPQRLLHAGVDAIVFEPGADAVIGPIARALLAGYVIVPRGMRATVHPPPFTRRERQILRLVVEGLTNREIADRMFVAEKTVRNTLSSVLHKLSLRHRTEAALFALPLKEHLRKARGDTM
jgi:DNA-binding NarL/FixJ family response regulator